MALSSFLAYSNHLWNSDVNFVIKQCICVYLMIMLELKWSAQVLLFSIHVRESQITNVWLHFLLYLYTQFSYSKLEIDVSSHKSTFPPSLLPFPVFHHQLFMSMWITSFLHPVLWSNVPTSLRLLSSKVSPLISVGSCSLSCILIVMMSDIVGL